MAQAPGLHHPPFPLPCPGPGEVWFAGHVVEDQTSPGYAPLQVPLEYTELMRVVEHAP